MSVTKVSIINLAIGLLGHKPVLSLDVADDLVNAASSFFDTLLPSILSTGNWRFSIQIQQLTLTSMVPPPNTGWQNIYLLPSGWLKTIRVIPNNYVWEIYQGGLIYSNWGTLSPVYMEFAFLPDIQFLPDYFINYFIYEIAAPLALMNAQKPEYATYLEKKRISQLAIAAATDSQNRPQFVQQNIPMLNKRYITGIIGPQIG